MILLSLDQPALHCISSLISVTRKSIVDEALRVSTRVCPTTPPQARTGGDGLHPPRLPICRVRLLAAFGGIKSCPPTRVWKGWKAKSNY